MNDYKELYLKEKMTRIKIQAELLVYKHEDLMVEHSKIQKELENHIAGHADNNKNTITKTEAETTKTTKKTTTKSRKKKENK